MINKFFYIDDNPPSLNEGIISCLNEFNINVVHIDAKPWSEQIEFLIANQYDGLLVDWRLGSIVNYDSEALAQHVRTMVSSNLLKKDIPVLLCSANTKFEETFSRDQSSHNLFLTVHTKAEIANQAEQVVKEMNDLAEAFKIAQENKVNIDHLLNIPKEIFIDRRIEMEISTLMENSIPHNLIQFVLKEIIDKPGPLIDENILAARLGIDLKKSEDWPTLRDESLSTSAYKGILSKGWERWWSEGLENWWRSQVSSVNLRSRSAKQRVKLLSEKTGLKSLVHAEKDKFSVGTEFWTVCVITKRPLDPIDGLRIIPRTPFLPWQEEQFVSPNGLLDFGPEYLMKNGLRLNPFEKEKWQKIRESIKQ